MAKNTIAILLLFLSILLVIGNVDSCHRCSRIRAFVQNSCSNTRFPEVCQRYMLRYVNSTNQSHHQLAQIALRVSLGRARYARAYLTMLASKLKASHRPEYQSIGDCIDQISNSVVQLKQSLTELQQYNEAEGVDNFMWHMSNVATWTSAALTDQTACAETFSNVGQGKGIQAVVKGKVTDVAEVTSNALALVTRFITRHRFSRGVHRP